MNDDYSGYIQSILFTKKPEEILDFKEQVEFLFVLELLKIIVLDVLDEQDPAIL